MSGIRVLIPPDRDADAVPLEAYLDIPYASLAALDQEAAWDHSADAEFAGGSFEPEGWCELEDTEAVATGVRVTPIAQRSSDGALTTTGQQCYLVELVAAPAYPPSYYRLQMRRKGYR